MFRYCFQALWSENGPRFQLWPPPCPSDSQLTNELQTGQMWFVPQDVVYTIQ